MTDESRGSEQALIEARRAKATRVRERGENPFANDVARAIHIRDLRARAGEPGEGGKYDATKITTGAERFTVHGRAMRKATTGGLSFLKLRDGTGEIQILCDEAALKDAYARLDEIDVADIVEASGTLTASKRGELSLAADRVRLITKALRPLPEKWHGLTDVETRYRQRYVDLVANPDVADVFRAKSYIVRALRDLLDRSGFLEVETPTMHTLIGGAAAKPFVTHHNALDMQLFMRIAPELYLKRLLVGGLDRVYEIGRCYRNEGISTRHNPEFTMLEFYWAYATYEDLMSFTEVLFRHVDAEVARAMPARHSEWKKARTFTLEEPFARVSMAEAVERAAKKAAVPAWTDAQTIVSTLKPDFGERIKEWSKSSDRAKKLDWSNFRKGFLKCENDGERLFACYEYLAEPYLTEDYRSQDGSRSVPVFIKDYPFEVSPLARRNDARPELTDRFELFIAGRELCNAFSELNDPDDQAARFTEQVAKKGRGAEETMDFDADYIRALEHGMPPAAGFGMGIDRLVMTLTNQPSIRDVIFFPLLRPE